MFGKSQRRNRWCEVNFRPNLDSSCFVLLLASLIRYRDRVVSSELACSIAVLCSWTKSHRTRLYIVKVRHDGTELRAASFSFAFGSNRKSRNVWEVTASQPLVRAEFPPQSGLVMFRPVAGKSD